MAKVDIYIVGVGIRKADQITREVEAAIRNSVEVFHVAPKNQVDKYLKKLCPRVRDLLPLYREGVNRLETYDQCLRWCSSRLLNTVP